MDLLAAGSVVCVAAAGGGDGCTAWEREECIGRLLAWSGRIMRACDKGISGGISICTAKRGS